jgi:predicted dinucleotide-binding enzyme
MNIGIVGTGLIGGTLARQLARAGHKVMASFSKTPGKLDALAHEIGMNIIPGTPAGAVEFGEALILAVHFANMDNAVLQMGSTAGKIVIDTSNQYDISLPPGVTAAQEVLNRLAGAILVKAFNTHHYTSLLTNAFHDPLYVMPYCGDNGPACAKVAKLIASIGFEPFYTGPLKEVYKQEMHGVLYGQNITAETAKQLVSQ